MLGGRVKTLHPAIHGAVLARRGVDADAESLRDHGIEPIDLVCVNLYPFEETIRSGSATADEALEQIDVGGPALMRAAAKNHASVAVVTSPRQYAELLEELRGNGGATMLAFRRRLAAAAFRRTAEYDRAIGSWMASGGAPMQLRYGENPHQAAALYRDPGGAGASIASAKLLHGKPPGYNNILDAAAALELVEELAELDPKRSAAAIVKHTNACGAAVAASAAYAFEAAYECDPLAAYGGVLAASARVDRQTAMSIAEGEKFLEVIVAPEFDPGAERLLADRWANVRLLAVGPLSAPAAGERSCRSIPGGVLVQDRDLARAEPGRWKHAAGPAPDRATLDDAAFAWTVCKHLKSNAIAIARGGRLLGAGCGQVDRVTACRLAVEKAGDRLGPGRPAAAASEAFFPFPDGPENLIDAGVTSIVHPGGSKRDKETLDLCEKHGVTCMLTGIRHFRH